MIIVEEISTWRSRKGYSFHETVAFNHMGGVRVLEYDFWEEHSDCSIFRWALGGDMLCRVSLLFILFGGRG
jgi:hypothetical protein